MGWNYPGRVKHRVVVVIKSESLFFYTCSCFDGAPPSLLGLKHLSVSAATLYGSGSQPRNTELTDWSWPGGICRKNGNWDDGRALIWTDWYLIAGLWVGGHWSAQFWHVLIFSVCCCKPESFFKGQATNKNSFWFRFTCTCYDMLIISPQQKTLRKTS